ncbi:MAG: AMIN domain-containing protein [Acidobacteriota bacterium]
MKVCWKQLTLAVSLFFFCIIAVQVNGDRTKFGESRSVLLPSEAIIDERCFPVLTVNGKVGFIASATTGSALSFSTVTGRIMSSVVVGENAGAISLVETDSRRLLAVPAVNDPEHDKPASVSIIDATRPKELEIAALTILPKTARLTPASRAHLTSDGRFGLIASSFNQSMLYSFSTTTGQIIGQLTLAGQPSEIALRNVGANHFIAVASAAANTLSIIKLDANGLLTQISTFAPKNAHFAESNNPALSIDGRIAYIAASQGESLFAIEVTTGELLSTLKVFPSPQRISLARNQNREELIAITRTHSTTANQSGGVMIAVGSRGQLQGRSIFDPPEPIEFSDINNVVFNDDASLAFVGAKSGMLFAFNTATGELHSHLLLGGELMSIAFNGAAQKIIAAKRNAHRDEISIIDFDFVSSQETDERILKPDYSLAENLTTPSPNPPALSSNRSTIMTPVSKAIPRVTMRDGAGNQIQIDASRVRFRSSKTLEIALDGKLTELIERGGWKFNVRTASTDEAKPQGTRAAPQISRVIIKPAKNEAGNLRIKIGGSNFQEGNVVEFIKAGAVLFRQKPDSLTTDELLIKIPEHKYQSLGLFSLRVINTAKLASNTVDVEPFNRETIANADAQILNKTREFPLPSSSIVGSISAKALGNGVQVFVKTNTQAQYSDFTLRNPSRIVVDVIGAENAIGYKTLRVNSSAISKVRVGQPSDGVVRIVLDASHNVPYKITHNRGFLIITAGEAALFAGK